MKKRKNIKWSLVDLTRPAAEIAEELDISPNAIYKARQRLGVKAENLAGGAREGSGGAREGAGRPPIGDSPLVQYQLRIPRELLAQVKREAEKKGVSASEIIRLALITYLNKHGKEENANHTRTPDANE